MNPWKRAAKAEAEVPRLMFEACGVAVDNAKRWRELDERYKRLVADTELTAEIARNNLELVNENDRLRRELEHAQQLLGHQVGFL